MQKMQDAFTHTRVRDYNERLKMKNEELKMSSMGFASF